MVCAHTKLKSNSSTEEQNPRKSWSGSKPIVEYFPIFGCVAPKYQKRSKLDDKSQKCVLIRVSDESKAWRLCDPATKKVIVSKDVVFEEEKAWDWGRPDEEIRCDTLEWEDEADNQTAEEVDRGNSVVSPPGEIESGPSGNSVMSPTAETESRTSCLISGRGLRERRSPGWMADYETGDPLDEESLMAMMMVMMVAETDLISFSEASKWNKAMMSEIESIERNQT